MKKFLTAVFFLSIVGLFLDIACLDSNPKPSSGDYIAFVIIAIVLLVSMAVSGYGAGMMDKPRKENAPQASANSLESKPVINYNDSISLSERNVK